MNSLALWAPFTAALLILKLTGVLTWAWHWVLFPLWAPVVLILIVMLYAMWETY